MEPHFDYAGAAAASAVEEAVAGPESGNSGDLDGAIRSGAMGHGRIRGRTASGRGPAFDALQRRILGAHTKDRLDLRIPRVSRCLF